MQHPLCQDFPFTYTEEKDMKEHLSSFLFPLISSTTWLPGWWLCCASLFSSPVSPEFVSLDTQRTDGDLNFLIESSSETQFILLSFLFLGLLILLVKVLVFFARGYYWSSFSSGFLFSSLSISWFTVFASNELFSPDILFYEDPILPMQSCILFCCFETCFMSVMTVSFSFLESWFSSICDSYKISLQFSVIAVITAWTWLSTTTSSPSTSFGYSFIRRHHHRNNIFPKTVTRTEWVLKPNVSLLHHPDYHGWRIFHLLLHCMAVVWVSTRHQSRLPCSPFLLPWVTLLPVVTSTYVDFPFWCTFFWYFSFLFLASTCISIYVLLSFFSSTWLPWDTRIVFILSSIFPARNGVLFSFCMYCMRYNMMCLISFSTLFIFSVHLLCPFCQAMTQARRVQTPSWEKNMYTHRSRACPAEQCFLCMTQLLFLSIIPSASEIDVNVIPFTPFMTQSIFTGSRLFQHIHYVSFHSLLRLQWLLLHET